MNDFFSYYEILDVSEKADFGAIKSAYRSKALKYHPDRVAEHLKKKSEEIFKQISEAYDVLSDPEKRKQYDDALKNVKGGRSSGQGNSGASPLIRVDRNYFKFENILPGAYLSDFLVVFNDGGGTLAGAITTDKPWVKLADTAISVFDYQEIEITIDTVSLPQGFSDSAIIEIDTNGGKEAVTVDISLESSFSAQFSVYLKLFLGSFRMWVLTTVLSAFFLIACLIHSCDSSTVVNKTGWFEGNMAFIPEIPRLEDLRGDWYGHLSSYKDIFISIVPRETHFEGKIFVAGIIGKIKGEIRKSGEIVFKIESFDDVFTDLTGRTVGSSEFLTSSFIGRLKGNDIEATVEPNFTLSRINDSGNPWLILNALISPVQNAGRFETLSVIYDLDFEKVWEATLKVLKRQKEKIRFENREEKIIITYTTEHSSLLGGYAHKYVVIFKKQGKTTEVIVKQFRYGRVSFSPISDSTYATDVYFFVPLEKELRKKAKRSNFVIQRLYNRKSFLSVKMGLITLEFKPEIIFRQY